MLDKMVVTSMNILQLVMSSLGVILFLLLPTLALTEHQKKVVHTNIKIVPAAQLNELPGVTIYETTAKLVFRIPISDFYVPKIGDGTGSSLLQNIHNVSGIVQDDIFQELHGYSTIAAKNLATRERRQVLLAAGFAFAGGMAAHSLYHKISKELFGDEDDVRIYVNKLKNTMQEELLVVETEVKGYSEEMSNIVSSVMKLSNEQERALLHLSTLQLQRSWLVESKHACLSKLIPTRFVTQHELRDQVHKLNGRLRKRNMTTSIPLHRISEMYKLPLAACVFTDEHVIVAVSVPIKRTNENWNLYEMVHNKFAYNGQTCSIYPHEQNYLAKSEKRAVLITSHMLAMCPVHEHSICLIPPFSRDNSGSVGCALALLEDKQVGEIANACSFSCFPSTELIVQQLDDATVVLTNAKTLDSICPDGVQHREFNLIGAVQVRIRCDCEFIINGEYTITPPLYCPESQPTNHDIIQISPNLWSRLNNALGSFSQYYRSHSEHTFDPKWNQFIPTLNLTVFKPTAIPDLPLVGDFTIQHFIVAFLVVNVIALWIFVIVICCAFVKA